MALAIDPDRIKSVGIDDIYARNDFRDIIVEVVKAANGHVTKSAIKYEIGILYDRLDKGQLY